MFIQQFWAEFALSDLIEETAVPLPFEGRGRSHPLTLIYRPLAPTSLQVHVQYIGRAKNLHKYTLPYCHTVFHSLYLDCTWILGSAHSVCCIQRVGYELQRRKWDWEAKATEGKPIKAAASTLCSFGATAGKHCGASWYIQPVVEVKW